MANPKKNTSKAPKHEKTNNSQKQAPTQTPKHTTPISGTPAKVIVIGTAKGPLKENKRYKLVPKLAQRVIQKGFATLEKK